MDLPGYDAWKTATPDDGQFPDERPTLPMIAVGMLADLTEEERDAITKEELESLLEYLEKQLGVDEDWEEEEEKKP